MLQVSSNASVDLDSLTRQRPEKRKGVRFDEADLFASPEKSDPNPSTADFLSQQGVHWNALAQAFDCDDVSDDNGLMDELLQLCCWWGGDDTVHEGFDDDDDDDDWLSELNSHIAGKVARSAASSTGSGDGSAISSSGISSHHSQVSSAQLKIGSVSSLRLDSLLRFDSKPTLMARRKSGRSKGNSMSSSGVTSCSSSQAYSQNYADDRLEDAFRGIVSEDNDACQDDTKSSANDDDFWGDVEF